MTRVLACAVCLAAGGSTCLGAGGVGIDFHDFPLGAFLESYTESGVVFTPLGPAGLLSSAMHPSGVTCIFDASADVDAPIRADLPEPASAASVTFTFISGSSFYVDAFDEDGFQVDSVSDFGGSDPFELVTLEVTGEGIESLVFGGFGGLVASPRVEYTPAAAACNVADLAPPRGVLDFNDVLAFLSAFGDGDAGADLAPPIGVLDFSDVLVFLQAFGTGCP
ncbi:MAG: GC-type dockerin domain-anchored protein [Phycisphaerales bacterium]